MRVIVTGGLGFIGSNFVNHLNDNWAAVLLQGWRLKLKTLIDAPIPKFKQICMRVQNLLHEGKVS